MVAKVARSVFASHPLGLPNTNSTCLAITTNLGVAHFAIGRYSQHTDPRIITVTRAMTPRSATHFLAVLRKWLRTHTSYRAVQTYTTPPFLGTSLKADGWVYVANHNGKKRWLRTL